MNVKEKALTQERLKELLDYNPDTGVFTWKNRTSNRVENGSEAGWKTELGYIVISIDEKYHRAHRAAWLYVHGYLPEHCIDHINRKPSDNRIKNLREVTQQCNMRNSKNRIDNKSGVKGVHWFKAGKKWQALLHTNGKTVSLGCYHSFENAVCARLAGEQCLDWAGCDGSSTAYQFVQKMLKGKKEKCNGLMATSDRR